MKIYNSMTRRKEEFVPLQEGKVGVYACGPTVYDFMHIGNGRFVVVFDTLRRYLEFKGYDVKYISNFTDIDDKMIKRANREGITINELAERFISEFFTDADGLGVKRATVHPRATDYIQGMIEMTQKLIDKGLAYEVDGDVYFDTRKFEGYGKLSHQNLEELEAGARVEIGENKKNPADFALWKAKKPGEPSWPSPWGEGRPGWHIECSVMSSQLLGETIDIHTGGIDLMFPHHENEIAQSEGATGKTFARYWMHNGFLNIDNEKMSKSLNNFFTVREVGEKYGYETARFWILSVHYRNPINFSDEALEHAKSGLERLYNCLDNLNYYKEKAQDKELTDAEKALMDRVSKHREEFISAMEDDLNTADAISSLFDIVREVNTSINADSSQKVVDFCLENFRELSNVLGILQKTVDKSLDKEVEDLIEQRQEARKNKDWAKSDKIRDQLKEMGIIIEDTPQGVRWKRER